MMFGLPSPAHHRNGSPRRRDPRYGRWALGIFLVLYLGLWVLGWVQHR